MSDAKKMIELGVCGKPHGIKGGFSFSLHNADDSILQNGTKIFLTPSNESSSIESTGEWHTIDKISFGNKTIAYLCEISDRNLVEAMVPFTISMDRADFPSLDEGEYYLSDLIGLDVYSAHTGDKIGVIKDFYDNGAQVVFIMNIDGEDVDIPFIEQFIPNVDPAANRVEIFLPEYIDEK